MSNVLVYSGPGVSKSGLQHTLSSLRRLLPTYDVQTISSNSIATDPWQESTSLFVLPGGRDLPYVEELEKRIQIPTSSTTSNSTSTVTAADKIRSYVSNGGNYLGICAGAYFASGYCEFEKGKQLEVCGERKGLGFFGGKCKGCVYPGFVYESDEGARMVKMKRENTQDPAGKGRNENGEVNEQDEDWWCQYNGGGAFLGGEEASQGLRVLARYPQSDKDLDLSSADGEEDYRGKPAVIATQVGRGVSVLFGTHPEFPLDRKLKRGLSKGLDQAVSSFKIPFTKEETEEEGENQDENQLLQAFEIKRLRLFGSTLAQVFGLTISFPETEPQLTAAGGVDSASKDEKTSTQSSPPISTQGPRLTPLFLASRDSSKISTFMNSLSDLSRPNSKAKQPPQLSHFKELMVSDASSNSDPTSQDPTSLSGSHLLSFSDVNDTFHFYSSTSTSEESLSNLCKDTDYSIFATSSLTSEDQNVSKAEVEVDLQKIPKYILVNSTSTPTPSLTPHFNLDSYFSHLSTSRQLLRGALFNFESQNFSPWASGMGRLNLNGDGEDQGSQIGDPLIYGEMVTSTQTMLDKNFKFLTRLPSGLTILATHQATGRGRGSNSWISPLGCLQFSLLLRLPTNRASSVVFVQYLAGLSIIQAIRRGLGEEYRDVGERIKIKWPNDVYARIDDEDEQEKEQRKGTLNIDGKTYAKLSGVLVNSQFAGKEFSLIVGCGINCLNPRPTTSLSDLIQLHNKRSQQKLEVVSQERLAGAVLATFEKFWKLFLNEGFEPFVEMYRDCWLHSDQLVTLEDSDPPTQVRIVGIATDYGTLRAVTVSSDVRTTSAGAWGRAGDANGKANEFIDLQPDGNSFDMLKNLIRSKK